MTWDQYEVMNQILKDKDFIYRNMSLILNGYRSKLGFYKSHPYLKDPKAFIVDKQLKLDAYHTQMEHALSLELQKMNVIKNYREQLSSSMNQILKDSKQSLSLIPDQLEVSMSNKIQDARHELKKDCALLDAYSPLKVLSRGYSITKVEDKVIKSIHDVKSDDIMVTRVHDGVITSCITSCKEE